MRSSLTYVAAIALVAAAPAIASAQIKAVADVNIDYGASAGFKGSSETSTTGTTRGSAKINIGSDASASSDDNMTTTASVGVWSGITAAEVNSTADEEAYARALAKSDTNVSAVTMNAQKVSVSYKTDAKLLGFIPVRMPVTASVYATGATTLNYPWYKFATKSSASAQLEADIKAQTSGQAATNFMMSSQDRAVLASRLYAALRANLYAGASMNSSVNY